VLDFLIDREQRQAEAAEYVRQALRAYDVQAVDTLIGQIIPPAELMKTLTDRKIAQELEKTYGAERLAERQRQELVRETTMANIQKQLVSAEQGVTIARMEADARSNRAAGEAAEIQQIATARASEIRQIGEATAHAYEEGVDALGNQAYAALQMMDRVRDGNIKIVPNVSITGNGGGSNSGVMDSLMGLLVEQKIEGQENAESAKLLGQSKNDGGKRQDILDVQELFDS
jgi:regulator of protease activity HflC (stomatin/prohibitin superfamily)